MKTTKTLLLPALGLFAITSLLGVAVFSAPGTLDAAERKLGVLLVPGPGADEARILAVKPVFKRQLKLLDGVSYRDASVPMSRARQAELNTLVNTAMMALNTKDFSGARAVLSALEDQMKQSPASSDKVFLARFYKAYGAALVGNGLREEGVARIKTSLLLFPNQGANEYAYSDDIRAAFDTAQREIDELPSGGVKVATEPSKAEVYLDGSFAGISPLNLDRLPQGNHVVRLVVDGYVEVFDVIQVAAGSSYEVSKTLTPAPYQAAIQGPLQRLPAVTTEQAGPDMAAVKEALGVDELAFVMLSERASEFAASGFYMNKDNKAFDIDDMVEKGAELDSNIKNFVSFVTGAQLRDEMEITSLGAPVSVLHAGGAGAQETPDELILDPNALMFAEAQKKKQKKSFVTEWWFITGVAVLAAGAITGVYFLTQSTEATSTTPTGSIRVEVAPY